MPLTSAAIRRIEEFLSIVNGAEREMVGFAFEKGMLLQFSDGNVSVKGREKTSDRLPQKWGMVFQNAGAAGLMFHGLRHEATSRFFERTELSEFEITKITGYISTRMLKQYELAGQ